MTEQLPFRILNDGTGRILKSNDIDYEEMQSYYFRVSCLI